MQEKIKVLDGMVKSMNILGERFESYDLGLTAVLGKLPGAGLAGNLQEILDGAGIQGNLAKLPGNPDTFIRLLPLRPGSGRSDSIALIDKTDNDIPFWLRHGK